jgi:hypothetical protein
VASRPSDYVDAPNRHLLEALCVSAAACDHIWRELNALHGCDLSDAKLLRRYRALSVMANRQSALISMLVTKLRLLPPRGPMPQMARNRAPWESID